MDTKSSLLTKLEKGQTEKYGKELENCVYKNNCEDIDNIIRDIGGLLS